MAASSALDTPNWVTLTQMHAHYAIRACAASESSSVCPTDSAAVSHLALIYQRGERRGLVSTGAESILSLLCLCFRRVFSLSL